VSSTIGYQRVIADGCADDTVEVVQGLYFPTELRVYSQVGSGAAAARNRGADAARGEILIFLDDDVIASPPLVRAHVEAHVGADPRVVVGPYLLDPPRKPDYLAEALYRFWTKAFDRIADQNRESTYTDLLSGNLSLPTGLFFRLGGFDPAFPECGIEDFEFGARAVRDGIPIVLAPHARARHLATTDLTSSPARNRRGGSSLVRLARRHPAILPSTTLARPAPKAQKLAFRHPLIGEWLARRGIRALALAQKVRFRKLGCKLYNGLRSYWFWRGVRDEVGSSDARERERDRLLTVVNHQPEGHSAPAQTSSHSSRTDIP
jgi:GT2 family glycosyltransferase